MATSLLPPTSPQHTKASNPWVRIDHRYPRTKYNSTAELPALSHMLSSELPACAISFVRRIPDKPYGWFSQQGKGFDHPGISFVFEPLYTKPTSDVSGLLLRGSDRASQMSSLMCEAMCVV